MEMLVFASIWFLILIGRCLSAGDQPYEKYSRAVNEFESGVLKQMRTAVNNYVECERDSCKCHASVIRTDLNPFSDTGITNENFSQAVSKGTKYQIISGKLYREEKCHFPTRCSGVEHYLNELASSLPDMELAINTRDWPQVNAKWGHAPAPVFSFSKTGDYYDIMYPAWSFWEGGPAIKLYPSGIGLWHLHRRSISQAASGWPWDKKESKGFFRGSRTSEERDPLVLLSRSHPDLLDAQYTKNQAWKSDADTLNAPAAAEVALEEHCRYKYLFNFRGVAASFRFKHLFLCRSLVFHVGDDWLEFFYPSLKPWIHYVPISPKSTQHEIKRFIKFFKEHDDIAKQIADRGYKHIWENLRVKDVKCYWKTLLEQYAALVRYKVERDPKLVEVKMKS